MGLAETDPVVAAAGRAKQRTKPLSPEMRERRERALKAIAEGDVVHAALIRYAWKVEPNPDGTPRTGPQQVAIAAWRAWDLGDASMLELFRVILALARKETRTWFAPARKLLEPIIGRAFKGLPSHQGDLARPGRTEEHANQWVGGGLERWALGDRETATEWARELGFVMEEEEGYAGSEVAGDPNVLAKAAAHDVTIDAYAFALAFLLWDREAAVIALWSLTSTILGVSTRRFGARPESEEEAEAYRAASRPWTGAIARAWESVFDAGLETRAAASVFRANHAAELEGFGYRKTDPGPFSTMFDYHAQGAKTAEQARAARARGFLPHQHEIPTTAFQPEPTPQEKEEP